MNWDEINEALEHLKKNIEADGRECCLHAIKTISDALDEVYEEFTPSSERGSQCPKD